MQILTLKQLVREEKILKIYSQNPLDGVLFARCDFVWNFSQYTPALCMTQELTQNQFWILLNPADSNKTSDKQRLKFLKNLSPSDICCLVVSRSAEGCLHLDHIEIANTNDQLPEA